MTQDELKDKALSLLQTAYGGMTTLTADRQNYLRYYNRDKSLYDTVDGQSTVVASDVHDCIEGMMPALMDIFYGGSDVVKASPQGPEDVQAAKLVEELLNFQFQREMNGFRILHDWFKSALLMDTAWVKYWWEEDEEVNEREYCDITQAEYEALLNNPNIEIKKVEVDEDNIIADPLQFVPTPLITSFDITCIETKKISRPRVEYLPEEEVIHNIREKNPDYPTFIAHRKRVHKSHLEKYGVDVGSYDSYIADLQNDALYQERFKDLGGLGFWYDEVDPDYTYIVECCLDEYDKKGRKQPKIVTLWGNNLLKVEDNTYGRPNYIPLTPFLIPGRMIGDGLAQKAMEYQDVSTSLLRNGLNNIYYANSGRTVVNPFRIEVDDLISSNRAGGVIRTKGDTEPSRAFSGIPSTPMPMHYELMVERNEARKENTTGQNKYNMGSDSREVNRTATGVAMLTSAAQMRTKHIARTFAETGVKRLFNELKNMNLEFMETSYAIQINGAWQNIDKHSIKGNYDINIDVGLGTGTKELKANQMMQAIQIEGPFVQAGLLMPQSLLETLRELYQNWGYKDVDRFVIPGPAITGGQNAGMGGPMAGQVPQGAAPQVPANEPGAASPALNGGGATAEPRIDPRILRSVALSLPQPVVGQ